MKLKEMHISLCDLTILLGANGVGKSNLVSFFKMLNFMTTDALQQYVAGRGSVVYFFTDPGA